MSVADDKERLRDILEGGEYKAYYDSGGESLWDIFGRWLRKLFDFFPALHVSDGTGSVIAYGLAAVVFFMLVWAIYWFSKQIVRHGRVRPGKPLLTDEELTWSLRDYMQKAEALKAEGAWRESVRFLFLALLFYMQERSWVTVEKWKTNWEYGEELQRSREGLVPLFRSSAGLFDRVWYGKEPINEADLTAFYEQVRSTVRETEASRDAQTD
ncbi:DUF4129 domain-containing protein [Paenibacillus contaminans]|uniref:Protein-glutamine gamma-glutamyltransferase-like C-terminal domain-containing protein n=1 Tax=Paenibacillus contaminans TaxID=450362 RepID=A0A329M9L2_9BACL|nr:DUF4129 domain-containing protein [Paenibacillus contaminans]RAV16438.1 hypothetical protein DQG23_28925 [Paenibacillus contaminans]